MVKTTLAAEAFRSYLQGEESIKTIFESVDESLLQDEETKLFAEKIEEFTQELYEFITSNPQYFIGENAEEIVENIYVFSTYALNGFLQELAEIETILPSFIESLEEQVSELYESEEEVEDVLAEAVVELFERAKTNGLSKGMGALDFFKKHGKKMLAGAAGVAALAGTAYGARKTIEHGEEVLGKKNASIVDKFTAGAKDYGEQLKQKSEEMTDEIKNKVKDVISKLRNKFAGEKINKNAAGESSEKIPPFKTGMGRMV